MKRANRILLTSLCAISCLLGAAHWFHAKPVHAQQQTGYYDDGTFYIYASIDVDSNYNLTTDSYMEVEFDDYEDIDEIEVDGYADQDGGLLISGYSDRDDYDPAEVEFYSEAPVAPGHEYGIESDGYACFDDGEGDCDVEYVGTAYASVNVAAPPATITGISPSLWTAGQSYQAVQITGTNFGSTPTVTLSDPTITVSAPYNTSSASPTSGASTTYVNLSVPATTPSEPVVVTVTPGSFGSFFSQVPGGPSLPGSNTAAVIGLQQSACPEGLDSNGNSRFSSIASTGNAAGSGSMTISFSAGAFNGLAVTAPYGPYSTPESVASHLAALITKQYASSGLTAQADGANILYKSSATLGTVSFGATGASFMANAAPMSCPSINLKYVLAVENDSVQWQQTNNQRGREVTYQLMLWPIVNKTKPLALIRFSDLTPASPAIIKEHLGNTNVASWNGYTSDNTINPVAVTAGQFEDILGTGTWPNAVTGTAFTDRWFSVSLNGVPLPGSIQTLDRAGGNAPANALHQKDHIVINLPTVGAPLLSGTSILNGASWDVSLQ